MCPKRPPERKTQNVSKLHYLLCFNHILVLPSALKICLFSSKILPWLPWPSFGHQGVLNKPLGWHLQVILGIPGPPLVSQGLPRVSQKSAKNRPKSLLRPGLPMGCPRHALRLPHGPQKAHKNTKKTTKKARWRPLREALLDRGLMARGMQVLNISLLAVTLYTGGQVTPKNWIVFHHTFAMIVETAPHVCVNSLIRCHGVHVCGCYALY